MPAVASPAIVGIRQLNARTLSVDCYYTGEKLKNLTYWAEGRYVPAALSAVNKAFRDCKTDEVFPIDPKLLDVLYAIGSKLDTDCRFQMFSGYRSPRTNAALHEFDSEVAVHSLHMQGQAVDFVLPGRSLKALQQTALALQMGGVGYYPDDDFLHVDVGRVRHWTGLG